MIQATRFDAGLSDKQLLESDVVELIDTKSSVTVRVNPADMVRLRQAGRLLVIVDAKDQVT